MHTLNRSFLHGLFCLLIFSVASAQQPGQTRQARNPASEAPMNFFAEAYTLRGLSDGKYPVDIAFRVRNDVFTYVASPINAQRKGMYFTEMVVQVECRDAEGIIRNRQEVRDSVFFESYEAANSPRSWIYGSLTIELKPGAYQILVQAGEFNNAALVRYKIPNLALDTNGKSVLLGPPLFVEEHIAQNSTRLRPYLVGAGVRFGSSGGKIFIPVLKKALNTGFNYRIRRTSSALDTRDWGLAVDATGSAQEQVVVFGAPTLSSNRSEVGIDIARGIDRPGVPVNLEIPVPIESLYPGDYTLSVFEQGASDSTKIAFRVVWLDMPNSLKSMRTALDALSYIAGEQELDTLDQGTEAERRARLISYWKQRDPSPGTMFNEAMAEYYRRVDYAFETFKTLIEPNGFRTERGKIYVLYGGPSTIERKLLPGGTQETWSYARERKRFVFETTGNGTYKLRKIEDL